VAEIAYLSLQEAGINLIMAIYNKKEGNSFFGLPIVSLSDGISGGYEVVIVSSLKQKADLSVELSQLGVPEDHIFTV
jgi:hypothetical protein